MVQIRKATIKDMKNIQKLAQDLCINENAKFNSSVDENFPYSKKGIKYFRKKLRDKKSCVFVAVSEGVIVGYLAGEITEEIYRTVKKVADLESIMIAEGKRSKGIGSLLVEEFFKWCKSRNIKRIKVIATARNADAIKFYKRKGFSDSTAVLERCF